METIAKLRSGIVETARKMSESGLSPGRSGNVSARCPGGFLVTPSAMPYQDMRREDIARLDLDGTVVSGKRRPSSEWPFHALVYREFPEARAVVHCHSTFATTLACLGRNIPAFHYMVAVAGGKDIRCSQYATFGTPELAQRALEALTDRKACLLENHGQLAWNGSLESAYELAWEVENLARLYWNALQIDEPLLLDDDEMDRVITKISDYRNPGTGGRLGS